MPEQMVTVPLTGRVDAPIEGVVEASRGLPDQVGNVAGATTAELHERVHHSSGFSTSSSPAATVASSDQPASTESTVNNRRTSALLLTGG